MHYLLIGLYTVILAVLSYMLFFKVDAKQKILAIQAKLALAKTTQPTTQTKPIPKILLEIEEKQQQRKRDKKLKQQQLLKYDNIEELASSPNYQQHFMDLVGYDPTDISSCDCLRHFMPAVQQSQCLFAKKSRVWGSPNWDNTKSIEENVLKAIPAILLFFLVGERERLDAFAIEVPGEQNSSTLQQFAHTVRRVLNTIAENDPSGNDCMNPEKHQLDRRGWHFTFNDEFIFVTCFAPCYPETHARYLFEAGKETGSCFILLQPEFSFGFHNIGPDHPWDDSQTTIRQKIRRNFEAAGRKYYVPSARFYPMAPMIVPPLGIRDPLFTWWLPDKWKEIRYGSDHDSNTPLNTND